MITNRLLVLGILALSLGFQRASLAQVIAHPPLTGVPAQIRVTIAGNGSLDGTYVLRGGAGSGVRKESYGWGASFVNPDLGRCFLSVTAGTSNAPDKAHVYVDLHALGPGISQWRVNTGNLNAGTWNLLCTPAHSMASGTAVVRP